MAQRSSISLLLLALPLLFWAFTPLVSNAQRLLGNQVSNGQGAANTGSNQGWQANSRDDTGRSFQQPHSTTYTEGTDVLPNTGGQIWRNYDISPYTSKYPANTYPERQLVDWILRETGTDIWFGEPLGILSATRETLRVYHTPEVHRMVHNMVDRFTAPNLDRYGVAFRLISIGNPNWRARAYPILQPIDVNTPGIQAWLVSKENAAILMGELRKRMDFAELVPQNQLVFNGQTKLLSKRQPVSYARALNRDRNGWLAPTLDMGQFNEGYDLEISPLQSADGTSTEVVLRAAVDQVEKLQTVPIDVPTFSGQSQRVQLQVPQVVSWRLYERFRWPSDQVLLLSCGVVAAPGPEQSRAIGLPKILTQQNAARADALLIIENKPAGDATIQANGSFDSPFQFGPRR